jgi:hypothetical protein
MGDKCMNDNIYFAIYKMNAEKATAEYKNEWLADYEEEYNPVNDGKCFMDDRITMWMMNDDWYCMIKIPDCDDRRVEYFLKDAYETIGEEYKTDKATKVFENPDVC